jgi:retron-type reverse transcriptase
MTPGPDAETADGMTMGKIERIIDALRHERYRFKPVRRHYIPKKDGRKRPLVQQGILTGNLAADAADSSGNGRDRTRGAPQTLPTTRAGTRR